MQAGGEARPVIQEVSDPARLEEQREGAPIAEEKEPTLFLDLSSARGPEDKEKTDVQDAGLYDIEDLLSWNVFLHVGQTSATLRHRMTSLLIRSLPLSLIVAVAVSNMPFASHINLDVVARLGSFMNIFMGMMLGFFLSSSASRWYACASAVLAEYDAIRDLQMQLFALGVSPERITRICRYGLLSAWLQLLQINSSDHSRLANVPHQVSREDIERTSLELWQNLRKERPGLVLEHEYELLKNVTNPAVAIWTWIASLIGHMGQDGEIPPMPSPTYTRIMQLVANAYGAIRHIKGYTSIQLSYIYIHTLATMVHFNNFVNAINLGISFGVFMRFMGKNYGLFEKDPMSGQIASSMQSLLIAICMSLLAPLLYHCLLCVGLSLSNPISTDEASVPVRRFLRDLEIDLVERVALAESPPYWEKPCFRPPK